MTSPTLGLVDYGSGNLRSVKKALEKVGGNVRLVAGPDDVRGVDALVLPGVGAFGDSVRQLSDRQLWSPLLAWLESGRPFLGVCLGYQLLFESSEESPGVGGFGFFKGAVVRFRHGALKVPHMGWNEVEQQEPRHPSLRGLPDAPHFFFVHSYFPAPEDQSLVTGRTDYGGKFAASIAKDRLVATQFHPEKSQAHGLRLLSNFLGLI